MLILCAFCLLPFIFLYFFFFFLENNVKLIYVRHVLFCHFLKRIISPPMFSLVHVQFSNLPPPIKKRVSDVKHQHFKNVNLKAVFFLCICSNASMFLKEIIMKVAGVRVCSNSMFIYYHCSTDLSLSRCFPTQHTK